MSIGDNIINLLATDPNLTSVQITERLNAKSASIKVTLHKLVKTEKLVRSKVARPEKTKNGPQNLYAYAVKQ